MVNATDRTTVQSAANPMRKWFLRGRELGTGEVRGHFVAMCLIAGGAGWYVNKVLLGAVGTNEVPVALMQRHAVALLTGFIVLGVLTRLWLAFVGAVSKDAPTGVLAPLANLASRRARGDVTSSTTESLFVASAAVANPVAVQADDSTNVASSGKSTGAGTFLLLFLIFVLALAPTTASTSADPRPALPPVPNIGGAWYGVNPGINRRGGVEIQQSGGQLVFINEVGNRSRGHFAPGRVDVVVATDWGNLEGSLVDNRTRINWSNNTYWTR